MPSEPGRPIPYVDEVALAFPELKIVCGHIGHPWTDEMISLAWKYENVYIDTSAYLPRYYPQQLTHFMNSYGQNKVLFGTNFPMLSFKECVDQALDFRPFPTRPRAVSCRRTPVRCRACLDCGWPGPVNPRAAGMSDKERSRLAHIARGPRAYPCRAMA